MVVVFGCTSESCTVRDASVIVLLQQEKGTYVHSFCRGDKAVDCNMFSESAQPT
jgi:hypothetical protein